MASGGKEDYATERDHQHVAGIAGRWLTIETSSTIGVRSSPGVKLSSPFKPGSGTGVFGDSDPQHRDQDDAQRREFREGLDHPGEKEGQRFAGKLVLNSTLSLRRWV
jgi:hypothetical protein